jgi:predicted DsbA family dithiol-disulfide isomerase
MTTVDRGVTSARRGSTGCARNTTWRSSTARLSSTRVYHSTGRRCHGPSERLAAARARFEQVAAAEGLAYGSRTHWYNSVPAHEAALWADAQDDGEPFRRAVYRAYFADGLNIASHDVLAGLADSVGLESHDLRRALAEGRYRDRVSEQFDFARSAGVTGVPAYIAGRYMMVGAQPLDVFRQLIETAG